MLKIIRHWLDPPVFANDEEKTAQARGGNTLGLYFALALAIAASIYVPFFARQKALSLGVILLLFVFYCAARFLLFRGRVLLAGLSLITSGWIVCMGIACFGGGVYSPMMFVGSKPS